MADLVWASDEHYADGVTDTKVSPASDVRAKGCIPGLANVTGPELNWYLHEVGVRVSRAAVNPNVQTFISGSGTWTKPAGALHCRMVVVGGGGRGGGTTTNVDTGATGGSSGEVVERELPADLVPDELTYSVGAGGSSADGSPSTLTGTNFLISAAGGSVRSAATPHDAFAGGVGGAPGAFGGTSSAGSAGTSHSAAPGAGGAARTSAGTAGGYGGKGGRGFGAGGGGAGGCTHGGTVVGGGGGGGAGGYGAIAGGASDGADGGVSSAAGGAGFGGVIVITTWCSPDV